jgi:hypothetical protein
MTVKQANVPNPNIYPGMLKPDHVHPDMANPEACTSKVSTINWHSEIEKENILADVTIDPFSYQH